MAVEWFRKSAEQGLAKAQNSLAAMYYRGTGITQDYRLAVAWFRKAAEKGNSMAQWNLGRMYNNGAGVTQNFEMAYVWFSVSAANGDVLGTLAAEDRDSTAKKLTPAALVDAQTLAAQFFKKYQPKE
ncbi:Polar organelle development protein [Aeromonas sp. DSM 116730]